MSPAPSSTPIPPPTSRLAYRIVIYGMLYLTMILGFPTYHYATALLIAVTVRHARRGGGFLSPFESDLVPSARSAGSR